jgi:hypothetical protein
MRAESLVKTRLESAQTQASVIATYIPTNKRKAEGSQARRDRRDSARDSARDRDRKDSTRDCRAYP